MRKIMFFVCIVFAMFLFVSCMTAPENDNMQSDGRVVGYIHGIIIDGNTGEVLPNVEVVYSVKGKTKVAKSDKHGYYATEGLTPGDYVLTFKRTGWATRTWTEAIRFLDPSEIEPSGKDFQENVLADRIMYQTKSELAGYVYVYQNNNQQQIAAKGATVRVELPNNYLPRYIETTTDNNGKYVFTNIPSVAGLTVSAPGTFRPENSNYLYSSNQTHTVTGRFNERVEVPFISMYIVQNNQNVEIINHTMNNYRPGTPITPVAIHLSHVVEASSLIVGIQGLTYGTDYTCSLTTNQNNTILTYTFTNNLAPNTPYTFTISGLAHIPNDIRDLTNFTINANLTTPNFTP